METVRRRTVNFDRGQAAVVAPFLEVGSAEHAALERLTGETLTSDAAELRALVFLGIERVRDALLEDAYNEGVDAGDFEETGDWVARTSTARRHRRPPA